METDPLAPATFLGDTGGPSCNPAVRRAIWRSCPNSSDPQQLLGNIYLVFQAAGIWDPLLYGKRQLTQAPRAP